MGGAGFYAAEYQGLDRTPVVSSNVAAVAYQPTFGRLYVEFLPAPFPARGVASLYVYFDVPPATHAAMLAAPSKGQFVPQQLKPFGYRKVW